MLEYLDTVKEFQSTLLMRGATCQQGAHRRCLHHFNPRSSCEERHIPMSFTEKQIKISIHAPHARSDLQPFIDDGWTAISIHAPHARSDRASSPSAVLLHYFNPRSSCEERLYESWTDDDYLIFQSTLLMRGATRSMMMSKIISPDFNPRSSCEERPALVHFLFEASIRFQSTLLMRGATLAIEDALTRVQEFQSTLLMRGATLFIADFSMLSIFQSTLLMRGATSSSSGSASCPQFQSTLLMRGATCCGH